jgi:hypothetical protein
VNSLTADAVTFFEVGLIFFFLVCRSGNAADVRAIDIKGAATSVW